MIESGFNVYPRAVEEVLYRHPDVIEAAMIGVPDEHRGEALKAFVVPRPGSRIVFVAALPRTAVGKIDKKRLREPKGA